MKYRLNTLLTIAPFFVVSAAWAQPRPATFFVPAVFPLGAAVNSTTGGPVALATGDFNHDGFQDVAALAGSAVFVMLGGRSGFAPATEYSLPGFGLMIATADLNGDGNLDLIAVDDTSASATLLFGKGDGTFAGPTLLPVPGGASFVTVGDFNGDSIPDLAFAGSSRVYLTLGTGGGSFGPFSSFSIGVNPQPQVVLAGDFHRTGKDDLIVEALVSTTTQCNVNNPCEPVYLYANNGDATFKFEETIYVNEYEPPSIAIADLNGDGNPDLVMDRLSEDVAAVLLGDGHGGFAARTIYPTEQGSWNISVADVNGDGIPDILTANDVGSVTVLTGKGDGTFQNPTSFVANIGPVWVNAGPYSALDRNDIVIFGFDGQVAPALSLIPGSRAGEPIGQITTPVRSIDTGTLTDMNGDGIPDLVVSTDSYLAVLPGRSNATFGEPTFTLAILDPIYDIVIADFNQDGKPDFAACNTNPVELTVALQGANNNYSAVISAEPTCEVVWAGDLNGDGLPDLLMLTGGTEPFQFTDLSLLIGNGDGTFQPPVTILPAPGSLTVGDFNGDGALDIAFLNDRAGQPSTPGILFGNGDGTFRAPVYLNTSTSGSLISAADFNGDGNLDLAVSINPGGLMVLLGDGKGKFRELPTQSSVPFADQLVSGDFNVDGKTDLLVNWYGTFQLFLGEGNGLFVAQPRYLPIVAFGYGQAFAGDMNNDGKVDIVSLGGVAISALLNTTK